MDIFCDLCSNKLTFWEKLNTLEIYLPGIFILLEMCNNCNKKFRKDIKAWINSKWEEHKKEAKAKIIIEIKSKLAVS